jgi:hypothetical protein
MSVAAICCLIPGWIVVCLSGLSIFTQITGSPPPEITPGAGSGKATSQQNFSPFRQALFLTVVITVGWIVCFWPARNFGGGSGVLWMSIAAAACLGPGWIVVFLPGVAIFSSDLAVMLVQTMVRLMSVSVVAVVVKKMHPELGFVDFFGWLVGFYFLALLTEVWLLFRQRSPSQSVASVSDTEANRSSG